MQEINKKNKKKRVRKVVVAGCLPERLRNDSLNKFKGIDAIVGLNQRNNIGKIIRDLLSTDKPKAYFDPIEGRYGESVLDDRARLLITPSHWAYLRISEGCNHRCSFCTIPAIRGQFRSKTPELVIAEAQELVSAGVRELNIIAQDTTSYGKDLKMENGLTVLISELEKITSLKWIRLMYLYPTGIDKKLVETIASSEKIVHYLDIPIQHISNDILKSMRRPDTKEQIVRLIEQLRSAMPDIVLRTTLIVGFPGETDRQFAELMDMIKWAKFDALGCFRFYPEAGTAAAQMSEQLPDKIKLQRLDELMRCQQEIAFNKNNSRIGSELTCLVDSLGHDNAATGRYYGQAPDIDSICYIKSHYGKCSNRIEPGDFIRTKVTATKDYDLILEQI
ncbi:30S ribosomal protein S12 methylthiotransferase RimO [Planctomycetota bacterium]